MIRIINIVASGDLGQEFDLVSLSEDLDLPHIQYEPEIFPGVQLRLSPKGAVMTIFSTGSYTITGVQSESELRSIFTEVVSAINEILSESVKPEYPTVNNLACKAALERELDLAAVSIGLGTEHTEYEPEQSPFVYYRPDNTNCVITIANNGKVVITGVEEKKEAERAFSYLQAEIDRLFSNS
ncbi:TATA-box-binding protein [Haloarcula japonica]|uniref:Transcription factor n=1 Tax=Haloarcula japonica (strain ATCC 49778 / DSM 6131 / JCM 7785 / NBRC 101032 / NCIMB 13157 / TR-1) TaxID=1227453 RepID=M0L675_HALJT|nr:transcription factor [Haloarcula japonica]EMA29087.1 transcription factor [Haloarcula japonica DSM 6131]